MKISLSAFFTIGIFCLHLSGGNLWACDAEGNSGITEENSLSIMPNDKMASDMTEKQFNRIIGKIEKIYAPIVSDKGGNLVIEKNWNDGTVNAYAQRIGNTYKISMFGGLARHRTITQDALATVVCHEMGHHLGGAPRKGGYWASNEGQSDYWGTLKCMRRFVEDDDNVAWVTQARENGVDIPDFLEKSCEKNFSDRESVAICIRTSIAGKSLGQLFKELRNLPKDLEYHTPDTRVARSTYDGHPDPQCRLDTYFAGSLCHKNFRDDVDADDPTIGVCSSVDGQRDRLSGPRPLCWYTPKKKHKTNNKSVVSL